MIKVILLTFVVGLATAQYGHGGSGYGPDGVRNRYFILGHGRPITSSIGNGVYGPSAGSHAAPSYRSAAPAHSAPSRPVSYAPATSHGSSGSAGYGSGSSGHGGHDSAISAYGGSAESYAPAAHSAPSYAPAPAPRYAPTIQSHSAPSHGSSASHGYSAPSRHGHHDDLAKPTPYDFGYDVHNEHGDEMSRKETGDGHGNVKGSYGYRDSYGIFRHVDYVADHDGFRADVKTNEPGTDSQDPADVHMEVQHNGYGGGHDGRRY